MSRRTFYITKKVNIKKSVHLFNFFIKIEKITECYIPWNYIILNFYFKVRIPSSLNNQLKTL